MSIKATHPLYDETIVDQQLMRDSFAGERTMKEKGNIYLKPTPGMVLDGMKPNEDGAKNYEAYLHRAVYPEFVSTAVESLMGMMHNKPPNIELPDGMLGMLKRATADGETMEGLLMRINEQQLVTGRVGALVDMPETPDQANPLPYIALYTAESIRNWDESSDNVDFDKLSLVVLDESGFDRKNIFEWQPVTRYRVLLLGDGSETPTSASYHFGVYEGVNAGFDPSLLKQPAVRGVGLPEVPFVFINTKDNLGKPDNPPLLPLARAALTVYQGEADYRQALFLQGQDTLVVMGGVRNESDDETRVGAGAKIEVDMGGDAKYIGVSATGLPELRQALENDYRRAEAKTGQLVDSMGSKQESGAALETRLNAQTATLKQVAKSGAAGLERLLKITARWLGHDENKVKVTPNLEFADIRMTGKDLVELMTAKNMGAPLANETIHANMKQRGLTEREFEEEMALLDEEKPIIGSLSGGGAPLLNDPPPAPAPVSGSKK